MEATGRRQKGSGRSLTATWAWTVARFVALTVLVGGLGFGASYYQRLKFSETTSHLETEMETVVDARTLLDTAAEAIPGVLYGLGDAPGGATWTEVFADHDREMRSLLAAGAAVMASAAERERLTEVQRLWDATATGVFGVEEQWRSGEAAAALAADMDPFKEPVWEPYGKVSSALTALTDANVSDLRERVRAVDRVQRLLGPVLAVGIALALVSSWLLMRRMTRRVVMPILSIRRAAHEMRDSDGELDLDLPHAAVELRDLASTITATAATIQASHRELRTQAHTDALTGLPNRKAFASHLAAELTSGNDHIGVLFIDLDDFKFVNDSMGHDAGDELLRIVARRLSASVRESEMVARLGGDEFAIVTSGPDPAEVVNVADRILASFASPVTVADASVSVSCSIGVAAAAARSEMTIDDLVRCADFAMYTAKSRGKNCVDVFSTTMHNEMLNRLELRNDLALATELGQLRVEYQPVVDISTGAAAGFEALVRWQHPTRGLIPPIEFISLAEESGDILTIGAWVLDQACADLTMISEACPTAWVSVNVSAIQLASEAFAATVTDAIARHGIHPGRLILEITEAVALAKPHQVSATLQHLRSLGVRVALDDFGVGYSSLRYLHELPVDVVKIDRSFLTSRKERTDLVLESIVKLSHNLALDVIAEGVETTDDLARLASFDGMAAQGYYFARSMPAADLVAFVAEARRHPAPGVAASDRVAPDIR